MSKKSLLEKIEVKEPCSKNWDEMIGSDEVRFCSHCSKSVNNLSAMTRKRALKTVRESKGNICVRYVKNPANNAPLFANELYQIARRAPRLAVGVMATALSLSSMAYAQGEPRLPEITGTSGLVKRAIEPDRTEGEASSISGTITDSTGAVIAGASVSLFNEMNGERRTTSDENGFYEFKDVAAGKYLFKAESAGFQVYQVADLSVAESESSKRDFSMEVAPVEVLANVEVTSLVSGGMIAVSIEYTYPLFKAVEDGNLEEVKNLIARGENVNAREKDDDDITPLFLAVENGNAEIAETLLNFGAKINARDENKQTPLMRLDDDAAPELVRLLIRHGAKVNAVDKEGNTTLMLAARSASAEVLQILLDHGAWINAQNREGQTALMDAADADRLEAVRTLILAGADVNLKNEDNETAWDLTSEDEIEKLLERYGAKVPEKEAEENDK